MRTALSPSVLRHIDEGRFELLPSGLYARSYIRSFAGAVGLDPEATLTQVEHLLPDAPDPLPALHAVKGVSAAEQAVEQFRSIMTGLRQRVPRFPGTKVPEFRAAGILDRVEEWRTAVSRCSAAAIDALLLIAVDALLVLLISWSSGIGLDRLLQEAGWALGSFCAIPIALYFLLFGGIAGSTLGRSVCSLIDNAPHHHHPLTLPDILRRAVLR